MKRSVSRRPQVVEQYLQLPQIASDFANYLQLYEKYRQVYRVDEIVSGTWEKVRASELRDAPFDEKLGVLGLLLSRLADTARAAYRQDALTDALHGDLLCVREGEKTLGTLLDEKREELMRRRSGSTDRDALFVAAREAELLDTWQQTLALEKTPRGQAFDRLKALFGGEVDARAQAADLADRGADERLRLSRCGHSGFAGARAVRHRADRELVHVVVHPEFRL